jgi:hypothetical protein
MVFAVAIADGAEKKVAAGVEEIRQYCACVSNNRLCE